MGTVKKWLLIMRLGLAAFLFFACAYFLLLYPKTIIGSVQQSVSLCLESVIASLFPFLLFSSLFLKLGVFDALAAAVGKAFSSVMRLERISLAAVILSLLGGYPVGAKTAEQLYQDGKISRSQGARLLLFCVNPGPGFTVGFVGAALLKSAEAGILIFASQVISCLLLGFLSAALFKCEPVGVEVKNKITPMPFSQSLVYACSKSAQSIIEICFWILSFSVFTAIIGLLPLDGQIKEFICVISEVTSGCAKAAGTVRIEAVSALIGWGGLCVHCQILPSIIRLGQSLKLYFTFRVINSALCAVTASLLLRLFPVSVSAAATDEALRLYGYSDRLPIALGLFAMSTILLLCDKALPTGFQKKLAKGARR